MYERRCKGIATLEATASFLFLIPFCFGLCALVDLVSQSTELNAVLDRLVYDSGVNPLSVQYQGTVTPSVAHPDLQHYVQDLSGSLEQELTRVVKDISPAQYWLEVGYSEIDINPGSGVSNGFRSFPFTFSNTRGSLGIPSTISDQLDVESELVQWEAQKGSNGSHAYATPSVQYSDPSALQRYLGSLVLISARVVVSLEGSFVGDSMELMGSEPFLYGRKVVLLRGDVSS